MAGFASKKKEGPYGIQAPKPTLTLSNRMQSSNAVIDSRYSKDQLVSPSAITDSNFYRTNPRSRNFLRPPPAIAKGFIQKRGEVQETAPKPPELDSSGPFNIPSQLRLFKGFDRLSASNSRPLVANRSGPSQNSIMFNCKLIYEPMGG